MKKKNKKIYYYKAVNKSGMRCNGCGVYSSYNALCAALNGQNLTILRAYPRPLWINRLYFHHDAIIHILTGLEWSLSTGQSLSMALKSLEIKGKGSLEMILQDVVMQIAQGKLFSQAWSKYSGLISPVVIAFFRQGESAGNLQYGIQQGRVYLERRRSLHRQMSQVLRLPFLNLCACIGAGYVLYCEVAQFLIPILIEKHFELSIWTKALIFLVNFSWKSFFLGIGSVSVLLSGAYFLYLPYSKRKIQIFLFRTLPFYADAQYAHGFEILSSLLKAKVSLLSALSITQEAVTSFYFKETLLHLKIFIQEGGKFSDGCTGWFCFSKHYIHLLRYGQDNGHLQEALQQISGLLAFRLEFRIQGWMRRLPLWCLVIVACLLLFFVESIFVPLYEVLENISHG
ncbi:MULTISPECIES: type II secretion system F family protein [Holospora]|uniref:Type II secretion system protein F n=2 Tax=Holospora TaxID=44747 RepID=A0A061JIS2_9PROT|nr:MULTISPECIES: type II secretion system F family protein [Holospora]ETZ05059.1 type II secretion system protein F [Holospora undulata HU1]GAJ46008.1 type II secretion system protein F [Holospora elegans E1]